jgi:hypothetical protein
MPPAPVQKSIDKIEDFQKLPDLLSKFVKLAKDIKQPITNFKSVSDLASAVRSASEKDITVDEKALSNYKVFREAMTDGLKIVYQDNDWVIGVPETYEASSHFKEPVTNWCTAYPDMYEEYLDEFGGEYYIHLNKHTGDLYQLHIETNQFKDASDVEIDRVKFAKENPQLKAFYDKIIPMKYYQFWALLDKQPTEEEQIRAVCETGTAIQYIKNPSEQVQQFAVENNGYAIKYIKNPSDEVQLAAVRRYRDAIVYIENPSEEAQLTAVEENWSNIQYIENPSEEVQLEAIQQNGWAIKYIKSPTEAVQLAVVKQNGWAIQFIENPSEQVQLAAVKQNGYVIKYIENPYPSVIKYVEEHR